MVLAAIQRLRLFTAALLVWALARAAGAGPVPTVAFDGVQAGTRGDGVTAVALEPATGRVAFADGAGVLVGRPGEPFRRVLRRAPVRDLVFVPDSASPEGLLLVATERGLFRVAAGGAVEMVAPGPGEASRNALRLAARPDAAGVASAGGAFVSSDARRWQRLAGSMPSGPAHSIALRETGGRLECWASIGGRLWSARLRADAATFAVEAAERVTIPTAPGAGPVDVVFGLPGVEIAVLYPAAVALRRSPGDAWEVLRPNLPPGARAERLAFAVGRFWLATDRGLLEAPAVEGPWYRAGPPAGSTPSRALAGNAATLLAATARGLLVGGVESSGAPAAAPAARTSEVPAGPSIQRVHLAALAYLKLQPFRMQELRDGLARRGWLPVVSLRLGAESDETRRVDLDEAFLSGATRHLTDRDRDRTNEFEAVLNFSWDLGDTAYHPEAIDVSREAREMIELRDDVLDEITQFYFERRRVLADLVRLDPNTPDAEQLRLRAAELAAGIDAWTGGWFSRYAAPPVP